MSSVDPSNQSNSFKKGFKDLQVSIDSASNNSAWMAKKQRAQIEKHIDILQNRLALLNQEEIKGKKKIMEMKKKTDDLFRLKLMNYNDQKMREQYKNNLDGDLDEKHKRSIDYREHQRENLKHLRIDLKNMKRQESMDIKKVSKENSERLKELKNQGERKNREKVNKIKSSVLTSKRKVEFFWEQRKRFYTEQHAMETMVNEQTKAYLEKELEQLEKVEMDMLERLEKTQDIQNKLHDKFEECFMMSASEIGDKLQKKEPKRKVKEVIKEEKEEKEKNEN